MADEDANGRQDLAHLSRVDLNLLVALQVLLEERSVTRAAARFGRTQSAMSHALNRSRRLFHDELLTRVGPSLELTARGRGLLGPLTEQLRQIDEAVLGNPGFIPETSTRRFRIALTSSTATVLLPSLVAHLSGVAPHVTVHAVALGHGAEDALRRPETDVALLPDSLPCTLPRERLYDDRWVVIAAPNNDTIDSLLSPVELTSLPHVAFDLEGALIQPYRAMEAVGVVPTIAVRAHDFLLLPFLLRDSRRIAVVQERMARRLSEAGLVRVAQLPLSVPPLGLDMVWNPRVLHDPAQTWLRERLIAAVPDAAPL